MSLERAVASLTTLTGWDSNSLRNVEPLLLQLPGKLFEETLAKVRTRRRVDNPPGLLVHLLRIAIDDWRQAQHEAALATWDAFFGEAGLERIKREQPKRYLLAWATPELDDVRPREYVLNHVADYVFAHTGDRALRKELIDYFVDASAGKQLAANQLRDWTLFKLDRERAPLDEVLEMLHAFTEGSLEVREKLVANAREIHANLQGEERAA